MLTSPYLCVPALGFRSNGNFNGSGHLRMEFHHDGKLPKALDRFIQNNSSSLHRDSLFLKLYGSVTTMDIADQLEKQGVTVERRRIILDKPIKSLGEFAVAVKLHPEVTASIKVVVVPEV